MITFRPITAVTTDRMLAYFVSRLYFIEPALLQVKSDKHFTQPWCVYLAATGEPMCRNLKGNCIYTISTPFKKLLQNQNIIRLN